MKPMMIVGAAAVAAAGVTALAGWGGWLRNHCSALGEADKSRLAAYIHTKYKIPISVPIQVTEEGTVGEACFHKLSFQAQGGARRFRVELFASPDFQYLTRELLDAKADPMAARRQQRALAADLTRGNLPVEGAAKAAATLVVFSDFQCPYCAKMADILKSLMATDRDKVRVIYHYFPLAMHPWAHPAAEAAACAQEQSNEAFWSLHDFLFAHQIDLTVDNVRQKATEHVRSIAGFDSDKFGGCLTEQRTAAQVETDLAFGNEIGIQGTPTVFLNGQRIDVVGPEQLRTLAHQLARDPNAVAPRPLDEAAQGEEPSAVPNRAPRRQLTLAAGSPSGNPPVAGSGKAAATLVVFSDFQCPYCARMANLLGGVTASDRERVRVVYRYFPLPMHAWARPAAEAAACAQPQGDQAFWSLHDFFFAHQGELTVDNLRQKATEHIKTIPNFDAAKFASCLTERGTSAQVEADVAYGKQNGIHGTPTVFLNGQQINVADAEQLRGAIRKVTGVPAATN